MLSVKGKDGNTINIPESMLSELRFKQKQDKWATVLKTKSTTAEVDPTLRITTSRDADFEKTLKGVQRAEQIKRAPLKKD